MTLETPKPATKSSGKSQAESSKATNAKGGSTAADETVLGVRITHPDRILFEGQGISKLDLSRYYAVVADRMLPYAAEHLLSLVRCPQGGKGSASTRGMPATAFPTRSRKSPSRRVPARPKTTCMCAMPRA